MGSIVSDFPSLPSDAHPDRVRIYTKAYGALALRGLALPGTPAASITRAAFLAHLQALVGQLIKDEITNDIEARGYSGQSDAQLVVLMRSTFAVVNPARLAGADPAGYVVTASTSNGMQATVVGGAVANFNTLMLEPVSGLLKGAIYARFRMNTTTPVLRGRLVRLDGAPAVDQLTFAGQQPGAPPVGNVFDIGTFRPNELPARFHAVLIGIPFCPNELSAADIAGAKV